MFMIDAIESVTFWKKRSAAVAAADRSGGAVAGSIDRSVGLAAADGSEERCSDAAVLLVSSEGEMRAVGPANGAAGGRGGVEARLLLSKALAIEAAESAPGGIGAGFASGGAMFAILGVFRLTFFDPLPVAPLRRLDSATIDALPERSAGIASAHASESASCSKHSVICC